MAAPAKSAAMTKAVPGVGTAKLGPAPSAKATPMARASKLGPTPTITGTTGMAVAPVLTPPAQGVAGMMPAQSKLPDGAAGTTPAIKSAHAIARRLFGVR